MFRGRPHGRRAPAAAVALALIGAMIGALIAGCGGDGDEGAPAPVSLSFVSYNYGTPDLGGQGTQQLIDGFEADHPDIRLVASGATSGDVLTRVQARTAAGDPPDIAQIGWSKQPAALASLPVVPVADLAPPAEVAAATAGILPPALAAGSVDGRLTVMPYTLSTPTMFYNATLFERAHLDPARPPATWAQVRRAALALATLGDGVQGVYVDAANPAKSDFLTQSLINSNGGSLLSATGGPQLASPPAVGALAMLGDLTNSGAQPRIVETDALSLFKAGKLGMLVTSTAVLASLHRSAKGSFTLRTAGLPAFGDQPARPTYSGSGLYVLTRDRRKQQAAWQFLKYLTSDAGFTVITAKIGYLPLRQSTVDGRQFLGEYLTTSPEILPAFRQFTSVAPYQPLRGPNADQARQILQDDLVSAVMLGGADPAATAASVNERLVKLLGAA